MTHRTFTTTTSEGDIRIVCRKCGWTEKAPDRRAAALRGTKHERTPHAQ